MAKSNSTKSGPTKLRFIMIDAEISEGDLNQITQAIQNALKPPVVPSRLALSNSQGVNGAAHVAEPLAAEPEDEEQEDEDIAPAKPKTSAPRKPSTPKVLDLDLTGDPSWDEFATEKAPKNDTERFLTVAAWFKLHKQIDAITTDHVYTCYRAAKWPTAIEDFNGPLRSLKHKQLVGSPTRGQYTINHLGLARVDELPGK